MTAGNAAKSPAVVIPPRPAAAAAPSWALRFALLAMFVYMGKIADILPQLAPLALGKVLIALALLALLFEGGGWRDDLMRQPVLRPFLGILLLAVVTVPFGIWPGNSVRYIADALVKELVFVLLLVLTIRSVADLRRAMWVFVMNGVLLGYALFKYGVVEFDRLVIGQNELAMFAAMGVGMLLPLRMNGFAAVAKGGALVLLVFTVLLSGSRGGYLGLACVFAAYTYIRLGGKIALTGVMLALVGTVAYLQLPSDIRGNVDSIINYEQDYNLTAREGRIEVWKRGLVMIKNEPLTGVGIHNFPVAEGWMHRGAGQPWLNAHNSALQVAAEVGLVGLVLYVVLLVRMWRTVRSLHAGSRESELSMAGTALLLAMVGYLVSGFFLSQGFAVVFYILIALVLSAARLGAGANDRRSENVLPFKNPESPRLPA